eukprot:355490-Chlamydomonas_euryale.AAC.3
MGGRAVAGSLQGCESPHTQAVTSVPAVDWSLMKIRSKYQLFTLATMSAELPHTRGRTLAGGIPEWRQSCCHCCVNAAA